ncbi:MAG: metallophosphoesterase family protein [Clostridiales bacterium]|nr:metallophosphoesterase family protein [Clostridiales bacterium]
MSDLCFNQEGKFKIMQLTDIHYDDGCLADEKTIELIEKLIQSESPDFIMITGDTVYGNKNLENFSKAVAPITASGIPWSIVFGNHDTEVGADYDDLFSEIRKQKGCMVYHDGTSVDGMGNHVLQIKNTEGTTKWAIIGLDSGNYNKMSQIGGYDYLKSMQIDWYQRKIKELERNSNQFSVLTFFHIALCEWNEVWEYETCYGEKNEEVCCAKINSGMFSAMLEAKHTRGVFVGHDHINDYYGDLYGITLGYGRATGYNTYGKEGYERGARIFILDELDTSQFQTYVVTEESGVQKEAVKHKPSAWRKE